MRIRRTIILRTLDDLLLIGDGSVTDMPLALESRAMVFEQAAIQYSSFDMAWLDATFHPRLTATPPRNFHLFEDQ
jgi:hypothetical protein